MRAAVIGAVMVAVPATAVPAGAYPVTVIGLLAVLALALLPMAPAGHSRLPRGETWAATAAVTCAFLECAIGSLPPLLLATEGVLVLIYLLMLDAPAHLPRPAARRWAAGQAPVVLAAVAVTGAVLAALAIPQVGSAWIALVGLAAAAVAYLVAIPRR